MKKILLVCVMILCLFGCHSNDKADHSKEISIAKDYVQSLLDKNYDKIENDFEYDDQMKQVLDSDQLIPTLSMSLDALGHVKERKEPFDLSIDDKTAVHFPTVFENQSINLTISFDGQQKIIGVFFNEYNENN